jgi:hypothetical protein
MFQAAISDLDLHVGSPRRAEVVIWWPRAKPRRKAAISGEKFSNRNGEFTHGGFLKKGYPQIIHFNKMFHYKPSIWGIPHLVWK